SVGRVVIIAAPPRDVAVDGGDVAEASGGGGGVDLPHHRVETLRKNPAQHDASLIRSRNHLIAALRGNLQRLFAQHVNRTLRRRKRRGKVSAAGRADRNQIGLLAV